MKMNEGGEARQKKTDEKFCSPDPTYVEGFTIPVQNSEIYAYDQCASLKCWFLEVSDG